VPLTFHSWSVCDTFICLVAVLLTLGLATVI
jgi:hypothetical protein